MAETQTSSGSRPQEYRSYESDSVVSFYRRHSGPAVQYGNNSAKTTVVEEGQSWNTRNTEILNFIEIRNCVYRLSLCLYLLNSV